MDSQVLSVFAAVQNEGEPKKTSKEEFFANVERVKKLPDLRKQKMGECIVAAYNVLNPILLDSSKWNGDFTVYEMLIDDLNRGVLKIEETSFDEGAELGRNDIDDLIYSICRIEYIRYFDAEFVPKLMYLKEYTGHQYYGTEMAALESLDNCVTCNGARCDSCNTYLSVESIGEFEEGRKMSYRKRLSASESIFLLTILKETNSTYFDSLIKNKDLEEFQMRHEELANRFNGLEQQLHAA